MNEEVLNMAVIEPARAGTLTVSIPEVARLLGISNNLAYEAAARGEIPTVKIGRRVLVLRAALERLLGAEAA